MPVYVAAGSIIPTGALIQSTKQVQKDLTVYVYAGKNGKFTLYEDEGINYNYEKGKYSTIDLIYWDKDKIFTIQTRKGAYNGMPVNRKINIIYVTKQNPAGIDSKPSRFKEINYNGSKVSVRLN
jgi:alpha-D-xyloside xylohydrolase